MEYLEFYSWDIKQSELHAPPFEQTRQHLAFIATEREVFGQDVSVAPFEFPYQLAFRAVSATEQRARAYIVRKYGQEQGILAESEEDARQKVLQSCGLVMGGSIHSTLPDEEINWAFSTHPEVKTKRITIQKE